jgi:hypothetical protein
MKRLVLIFLLLPLVAWADSDQPDNRPPDSRSPDRTVSGAVSVSTDDSTSSAASESVSEVNVMNNISLQQSSSGGSNSDDIRIRNVPSISASDVFPTVSCFKRASFSFGAPRAGGFDEDCVKREYIRLAFVMGAIDRAVYMWCKQPAVYEDFGSVEDCLMFEAQISGNEAVMILEQVNEEVRQLTTVHFVTEPELKRADTQIRQQIEKRIAEVDGRVIEIEQRLNVNAAAARRAALEREEWKTQLATTYLTDQD